MAFGPIMKFAVKDKSDKLLPVEMAPIAREDLVALVSPGMQQASVSRYLNRRTAPVLDDEYEWYDRVRKDTNGITWGIWVEDKARKLVGVSAFDNIKHEYIHQATSGSLIFDENYWEKGIATSAHKARTWYGFWQMGLVRLTSEVIQCNIASLKALGHSGYFVHNVERNVEFIDGKLQHAVNLECLNPADWAWAQWWGDDCPADISHEARKAARDAMDWAEKNVTLL
jgi:RimJ/RimL family protein N-acetyltransferase